MNSPILISLVTIIVIQSIFSAFAISYKSDKLTDLSYGLTFLIIATSLFFINSSPKLPQFLIFLAIVLWGIRLSAYLFARILKNKKDKCFDKIRDNDLKFGQFWLFQAISIWIISLTFVFSILSKTKISGYSSFIFIVGLLISTAGLVIETIADLQKHRFKTDPKNKDKWIQTGPFRYSRHPNYFGEIIFWWGILISSIPLVDYTKLIFSILGPSYITFLLLKVSGVPILEKAYDKKFAKNKEYLKYKKNTSLIIPSIPKRK